MRRALFALLLANTAVLAGAPARAETDYPYCMHVYTRDQYVDCSFSTLAQCQMSASGRPAQCYLDPFYKGKPGSAYHVGRSYPPRLDNSYDPYAAPASPVVPGKRHHKHKRRTD